MPPTACACSSFSWPGQNICYNVYGILPEELNIGFDTMFSALCTSLIHKLLLFSLLSP